MADMTPTGIFISLIIALLIVIGGFYWFLRTLFKIGDKRAEKYWKEHPKEYKRYKRQKEKAHQEYLNEKARIRARKGE